MKLSRGIYDSVGNAAPATSSYLPSSVVHYTRTEQLMDNVWNSQVELPYTEYHINYVK